MKAIIAGGGIGGLAAALSLEAAGIECAVLESVRDIAALGLGINLQPNAVRELIELGLGEALAATAIETSTLAYYNRHGQLIWSEPRGRAAGYAWPQYSVHRGELLLLLLDAVRARLGAAAVREGRHVVAFEQDARGVTVQAIDRATGGPLPPERGDILIGADGIHSTVRRQLYPAEAEPVASGNIQWRGAVEAPAYLDGRSQVMIGHYRQRMVVYPMSARAAPGRSLVNWLALLGGRHDLVARESWDRKVPKERFFAAFRDWNFPWIKAADLVAATADIYEYAEMDHDPLPRWSFGRVTLLGDAAHAMRPVGSQAGSQAIVDARVLAQALATEASPEAALRAYEAIRLPAMNEVILRNRAYGPEIVMQMAEERAPQGFARIEEVIPRAELEEVARSFKQAAGFDPETLNRRPSLSVRR
ncbi:MAG TPA: flavin-dependent oxidoreductase [Stellaceae bacterium]|nr:flavin-dependent oxidoreductase [Stellaceae bacterium]